MPIGFLLKAVQGSDYDSDELYKSPQHAAYIKNMCLDLSENDSAPDGTSGTEGDNQNVFTPIESTEVLCPMPLPEGVNYCIGYYEAKEVNEGYVFVYNSLGQHLIYVIDGYTSRCQVVRQSPCLNFKLLPEHFISLGRCVLITACFFNKATGLEERRKYLVFTDDTPPVKFISVTDSIATKGFSLPFFKKDNCSECDLLSLGLPTPDSCIEITPIIRPVGDTRDNLLNNKAWQFRVKFIDVWWRESEHGIISDLWYSTISSCIMESSGQPRCLSLSFDAGCSIIQKIQIEFRIWNANEPDISIPTDWFLYDTLDKYDQTSARLQWWERTINPALNYDPLTNKITFTFCADKGTTALPVEETSRNYNPLPLTASTVFAANQSIGTANHRRGFAPLDKSLLDQITYDVVKPDAAASCNIKPRTIVVYGIIVSPIESVVDFLRTEGDLIVYGRDNTAILKDFGQVLPLGQKGFVGYFAGTSEFAISTQVTYSITTHQIVEVGVANPSSVYNDTDRVTLQRWTFTNITPGKKVFRVANQKFAPSDPNYQKSSMATMGTVDIRHTWNNTVLVSNPATFVHPDVAEIHIEQCEGDVDLIDTEIFMLVDFTVDSKTGVLGIGTVEISNTVQGYLYEDEISRIPIEKAWFSKPGPAMSVPFTDHNGYYWATSHEKGWSITLYGAKKCVKGAELAHSQTTFDQAGSRNRDEVLFAYRLTNPYPRTDRIYIKGRVVSCDQPTIGVSGVLVILTGGSTAVSDESGYYTIIAHDRGDIHPRFDLLKFAQRGLCQIGRCEDECSSCFDDLLFGAPPCTGGNDRVFNVPTVTVKLRETGLRGPQNGGRYELAIVPYYNIGQPQAAQRVEAHVVDMPTIGQTGVFAFSRIHYKMPAGITFPLGVKYFTFAVSKNLNWDNFLSWVVEKVEYVDNTGNQNTVNPSQIKLYYSGLIEYNLQQGLATNAVWQFLDEKTNPIIGDRVEFIVNGDGNIFTKRLTSLVKFDKAGSYILVNYSEDLKDLKDGLQIKLLRPHVGTNSHFFYEQCRVVRVTNGKISPADSEGYLTYFDAYMLPRQIPIPFYADDPVTHLPVKDLKKSILKTFTYPFEHHSPSDLWGDHAANRGRVHVLNPFENQQCRSSEISLTRAMANDGILNGISYFEDANSKEFDEQEWGSITVVIANIGSLTVICQQDNFEVGFDDNSVRVNREGGLTVIPLEGRMGRPQRKKGDNYGCHKQDINTLCSYQGLIMFLDRSEAAWIALYGDTQEVSANGFRGHLKDKIKYMLQYNQSGAPYLKYFHASFDPRRKQALITLFTLPRSTNPSQSLVIGNYVNQLRYKSVEANETLGYNPFDRSLKLSYSFTPEYYGTLYGHTWDNQLLSFKNGVAYMHHKNARPQNKSYLVFYGEVCEAIYQPVLNIEPDAVKRYLWTEVMCREQQFFVDEILTESGQRSMLLLAHWEKRENFFTADFKCDLRTYPDPNITVLQDPLKVILEGNPLSGKWIKVRYVYRPEGVAGKYFEFDGVHIFVFLAQKSGTAQGRSRFEQEERNRQPQQR